jgi:GWxTD domain-containing protein
MVFYNTVTPACIQRSCFVLSVKANIKNPIQKFLTVFHVLFVTVPFMIFPFRIVYAQSIPRVNVSGHIYDAVTKKPIYYANVFIANTTRGSTTDQEGFFRIPNVPLGNYELVVSMMGYALNIKKIDLLKEEDRIFNFSIMPKILEGEKITVSARYPYEWKRNFRRFKELFIGQSSNGSKCAILNPEVLDLSVNKETGEFRASAEKPLQIENRSLGYAIEFYLTDFTFKGAEYFVYVGKPKFTPLACEDEKEERAWQKNRLKTYEGSLRHFLATLARGRMKEDKFFVYNVLSALQTNELYQQKFDADDFISPTAIPHEWELSFSNFLLVKYKDTNSWLKLNQDFAIFNTQGHLYDAYAINKYGYWARQRFADELPWDYSPDLEYEEAVLSPQVSTIPLPVTEVDSPLEDIAVNRDTMRENPVILLKQAKRRALADSTLEATQSLYRGLQLLKNHPYADTLYGETVEILSSRDKKRYESASDKGKILYQFWQKQDPTPATLENERYTEHIHRWDYIRRYYSSNERKGYDDRGIIYLRYGPPFESIQQPVPDKLVYANECWIYRKNGREIVFDFIERSGSYRLATDLTNIVMGHTTPNLEELEEFIVPRQHLTATYANLASRLMASNTDPNARNPNSVELSDLHEVNVEHLGEQSRLPPSTTDFNRTEKALRGALSLARFPERDRTRLEIYYGILSDPYIVKDTASAEPSLLRIDYTIRDTLYDVILQKTQTRLLRLPEGGVPSQNQIYIGQITERLLPGYYIVSVEIKDPRSDKVLQEDYQLAVSGRAREEFTLSDIEFAYDVTPMTESSPFTIFAKKELMVLPHPFSVISSGKTVFVYFEIDNLLMDQSLASSYEVEYAVREDKSSVLKQITSFSRRGALLKSSYERRGSFRNEQEYFSLDFSKLKSGRYILSIQVKDQIARREQLASVRFQIVR